MTSLQAIQQLYADYLEKTAQLKRQRHLGEGLLGIGGGSTQDPCHDQFVADLKSALSRVTDTRLASNELKEILEYIYWTPLDNRDNQMAYWMLLAVQGLTVTLISGLERRDAAELWNRYQDSYPRPERLPTQKQVLNALHSWA